jgi:hypothetical protein
MVNMKKMLLFVLTFINVNSATGQQAPLIDVQSAQMEAGGNRIYFLTNKKLFFQQDYAEWYNEFEKKFQGYSRKTNVNIEVSVDEKKFKFAQNTKGILTTQQEHQILEDLQPDKMFPSNDQNKTFKSSIFFIQPTDTFQKYAIGFLIAVGLLGAAYFYLAPKEKIDIQRFADIQKSLSAFDWRNIFGGY